MTKIEKLSPETFDLLNGLHDYMLNKADADYQGEETGYVNNEEMNLLGRIAGVLGYL